MRQEGGSATVEFALVSILLIFLALGVIQVALVLHVRNTITDAATEGARWAALADSSESAGMRRTRELIAVAVGSDYAGDVSAKYIVWRGLPCVQVTVTTQLPIIGLWGPAIPFTASGHASREVVG